MKRKELIINPYFISGLLILILNDFYLKYEYGNLITGKLSDFAGLLIFPIFMTSLFPGLKLYSSIIIGIGFLLWKSPVMTPVIDLVNQLPFLQHLLCGEKRLKEPFLLENHTTLNFRKIR
jgi:hypothetical protein